MGGTWPTECLDRSAGSDNDGGARAHLPPFEPGARAERFGESRNTFNRARGGAARSAKSQPQQKRTVGATSQRARPAQTFHSVGGEVLAPHRFLNDERNPRACLGAYSCGLAAWCCCYLLHDCCWRVCVCLLFHRFSIGFPQE